MVSVDHTPASVSVKPAGQKIRIGMVLDQPFPPHSRVEREAVALVEAGYEVHLLCLANPDRPDELSDEFYRGIYVHRVNPKLVTCRVPVLNWTTRLPYQGLIKNYFHHYKFIDIAWHTLVDRFVAGYGIHILHVHDLRLAHTGLSIAKRYRIALVLDLHENYPALMQQMKGRDNPVRGEKQRVRWEAIEADAVQRADQVITVIEEARQRLLVKGLPPSRAWVIENTVDVDKYVAAPIDPNIVRHYKPAFMMCYVGHHNDVHRGIHTVLEAMGILRDELPELQFVGAGAYRELYRERLDELVRRYQLEERVHFTGWLDETEFGSYIEASDICVCPHLATDHTQATFPNKPYLYHLYKKPIVVSNARPLARYVEATQGGLVFDSGDAQMLADRIRELYYQPELRRQLGNQGHQAVMERFNWAVTAKDLVSLYQRVSEQLIETARRRRQGG